MRTTRIIIPALVALVVAGTAATTGAADHLPAGGATVATYRGDAGRTGRMPGPGPMGDPRIAWQFRAQGPFVSSPALVAGMVVAVSAEGVVHVIDLRSGDQVRSVQLQAEATGTPLIIDDMVVIGDVDGTLNAIALADGATLWKVALDGGITGSPVADADHIMVGTDAGGLYSLEAVSGRVAWRTDVGGSVPRSVAADHGIAFVGIAGGSLVAVTTADGAIRWSHSITTSGDVLSPTVADGSVYAAVGDNDDGLLVALDASSGQELWRYADPDGPIFPPAIVDGRLFVVGHDHHVVALDAATGAVVWDIDAGTSFDALPAFVDDVLYVVGVDGPVLALDTHSGAVLWGVPARGTPFAPIVADGYVLVPTDLGILYAFGGTAR